MKKLYSILLVLALLLPVLAGCKSTAPAASPTDPPVVPNPSESIQDTVPETTAPVSDPASATVETENQLTRDEAIDIALKDAGLTKDQIRDLDAELDRDDGVLHYDVDFEANGYDYEYEIHAESGKILKSEKERD